MKKIVGKSVNFSVRIPKDVYRRAERNITPLKVRLRDSGAGLTPSRITMGIFIRVAMDTLSKELEKAAI